MDNDFVAWDVYEIDKKLQQQIDLLDKIKPQIANRLIKKAETKVAYERSLADAILRLKFASEEIPVEVDGKELKSPPPIGIMTVIAKGMCWREQHAMEEAEAMYKSIVSNIGACETQMSGLQTLRKTPGDL